MSTQSHDLEMAYIGHGSMSSMAICLYLRRLGPGEVDEHVDMIGLSELQFSDDLLRRAGCFRASCAANCTRTGRRLV